MASKSTQHCSFAGIVEFAEPPRILRNSTISVAATLQGPLWTTIPDLRILGDIHLDIEFYNESNEELTKGCVAICFGCISFRDKSPGSPGLFVRASRLNPYVSVIPIAISYLTCPGSFPLLRHLIAARENHSWIPTPFLCPL